MVNTHKTVNGIDRLSNGINGQSTDGANGVHPKANGANGLHDHLRDNDGAMLNGTADSSPGPTSRIPQGAPAPIAICGMACRLPGGLSTPEDAWQFICAGKDGRIRVPQSRYNVESYYSPGTAKPATVSTEFGYFLDESVDLGALDTSFFTLPRTEVERADPQQRLMLEVARECFEDAGVTNWKGKTIGCYIGNFGEDWIEMYAQESQQWGLHRIVGTGDFVIANRLSYEFDINGPSMTIRTACSAALVALNEACSAIGRGDCESALVGGVNLIMGPNMTQAMTEQGILSRDGASKSFSAEANGYARGEAVTAIYIKPLAHAIRDGDPVRAVIRATSHNSDGRTPGLSQPSTDAQEALMRRAYALAGIDDFGETAMVECHGTGTQIGDPIEAKAVARVFGEKGVYIGSVKPNLGHTEAASGLVSLIKMVKALEHRVIPPNIRFKTPNPNIPFEEAKLVVPLEPTPWPKGRLERVSLNSFGVGGANAHVILESAASHGAVTTIHDTPEVPQLLLFSANTTNSLDRLIKRYETWVEGNPDKVTDLAYTLARRREHLRHRAFAIVQQSVIERTSPATDAKISSKAPNLVMVFTGQGASWPLMGRELLRSNEAFRSSIRSLDKSLEGTAPYSIEAELKKSAKNSRLSSAELAQPLCTAVQIGLVDALRAVGVTPSAVVGHSSGEIAGAYAAGALTAGEAIVAAHYRGSATMKLERSGAMAAVGMGVDEIRDHLIPNVSIACDNSPQSVTISGDADAVKAAIDGIQRSKPDIMTRMLLVDKAYHSHHMTEIADDYHALLSSRLAGTRSSIPFFSSLQGKRLTEETVLGPRYWVSNLESRVRFREAVNAILDGDIGKNAVFLEVGPHSALAGPLRQTLAKKASTAPYVPAMIRKENCMVSFLAAIGKLYSLNVPTDLAASFPVGSCLPDLPRYPWHHEESYWYESRVSKEWRQRRFPLHDLLGVKTPESTEIEPVFRNLFHLANVPWVRDHRLGEDIVFPFAGYIALAGEAIRQIGGAENAFSVRNILVSTALVLTEGKPTEIVSSFRPHRLTNSINSTWWEFSVSSHNGHAWVKHCSGEVSAILSEAPEARESDALPRKLSARKWYEVMEKGGLNLGPAFRSLQSIETSAGVGNRAIGQIVNGKEDDTANYHIHPTVLDGTIQILGAAAINGRVRDCKTWLPTGMERFSVWRCSADMTTDVSATLSSNKSVVGGGRCIAYGKVVVEASGIKLALADGTLASESTDTHAAARFEWAPDINLMVSPADLLGHKNEHLLEELGQLCILASERRFRTTDLALTPRHLLSHVAWIKAQAKTSPHGTDDDETINTRIQTVQSTLQGSPAGEVAKVICQVHEKMDSLVTGLRLDEVISKQDRATLSEFEEVGNRQNFIRHLCHSIPNMRILELGTSGMSAPSEDILKALRRPNGQILCSRYTFTSPGYISSKDQDKGFVNLNVTQFDIHEDPGFQGLAGQQYDLIVASNVLRSSSDFTQSLVGLKALLSPTGRLLLQEDVPTPQWSTYIHGVLPHPETPSPTDPVTVVDANEWQSRCKSANLGSIEALKLHSPQGFTLVASHTAPTSFSSSETEPILALCNNELLLSPASTRILDFLRSKGHKILLRGLLSQDVPSSQASHQTIISLLDLDGKPFLSDVTESRFRAFQDLVRELDGREARILWVTASALGGEPGADPGYAQVLGLARVLRSEQVVEIGTCQIDDFEDDRALDAVVRVLERFGSARRLDGEGEDAEALDLDYEWAVKEGVVHVGRIHPFALVDELLGDGTEGKNRSGGEEGGKEEGRARLDIATPGRINSLHWVRQPREELKAGEVEVKVCAAGLNFRDILVALGVVELPIRQFGLEASGYITRVAPDVDPGELKVGDRVFCLKKQAFSTFFTTPTVFCVRIPDHLSFEDASAMLMPYVTALHSLVNVARLGKGQSVLVHSACGGVGLAAVQVCRMLGAELYVTVGNEEKVQFLMDNFDIPRNRIFDSRSQAFVEGVARETNGRGIDVILNSLSGELLHATWTCVAEFGTLVEIGKRDLIGQGKLDMQPFLANRSYCCIDIDQLWKKPQLLRNLILDTLRFYVEGHTTPVRPSKVFPITQTQDAFRYMQKGQHIGRVCVSIPHSASVSDVSDETLEIAKVPRAIEFKAAASYLLVGGLGGLGRAISSWMVEHGARELIFLSRSAGRTGQSDLFVQEMQSMGCNVKLVAGDVTKLEDVSIAVATATHPLKGVVQMSMVLRDQNFKDMPFEDWMAVSAPKVNGTWSLHQATVAANAKLDFFVLFSSLSGVIGQPGQAPYASGNTFLDAFSRYRNSRGLPASVVDIGAVEEVGYISENKSLMNTMKATGFKSISERELLDAMVVAMLINPGGGNQNDDGKMRAGETGTFDSPTAFILGLGSSIPLTSPSNRAVWKRDRRMAAYHNVTHSDSAAGASAETLKPYMALVKSDPSLLKSPEASSLFALEIGKKLFDMLLRPHDELNTSLPMSDLGLDSLVALELRTWWKQVFSFDITVLEMLGMGSLDALGQHAADELYKLVTTTT